MHGSKYAIKKWPKGMICCKNLKDILEKHPSEYCPNTPEYFLEKERLSIDTTNKLKYLNDMFNNSYISLIFIPFTFLFPPTSQKSCSPHLQL